MPCGLCFCLSVGPTMGLKWQKCLCCVTLSDKTAELLPHQGRDWLDRPLEMDAQARFMLWNWGGEVERGGELCGLSHCEIFLTCISKSSKNARSNYTLRMRLAQRHLVWLFISDYQWAGNQGDARPAWFFVWANQPYCSGNYRLASQCHGHPRAVLLEIERPHAGGIGIILNNRHISLIFISFLFFWPYHMTWDILVFQLGIKPTPLHWNHEVLTTGPLGKSK